MSMPEFLLEVSIAVIAVVSLLTNLSVLLCFKQSAELRSHVPGIFILNLSFSNILLTIINRMVAYSRMHSLTFALTQLLMDWGGYSHTYASCTVHLDAEKSSQLTYAAFTALFHCGSFALCLLVLCFACLKVLKVARSHCKRIDVITVQALLLLVDIPLSVKERCLAEQKKRRQRMKTLAPTERFIRDDLQNVGVERMEWPASSPDLNIHIDHPLSFTEYKGVPYYSLKLVELLPSVHIPRYWGMTAKCLSYAKASSDPLVYCLLRQQDRKVLVSILSRVVRNHHDMLAVSGATSALDTADENCIARVA
ncbi:LOW QUALITY PROTEIN: G-protein coupled receptor 26 [Lycodopsis pacificus]